MHCYKSQLRTIITEHLFTQNSTFPDLKPKLIENSIFFAFSTIVVTFSYDIQWTFMK